MSIGPDDPAATIRYETAVELVARATPQGRRLLERFAQRQLVRFAELREELDARQEGLNAILGRLTTRFREIQGDPAFYITLPDLDAWAIGYHSRQHLRQALREVVRAEAEARQPPLRF